MVDTTQIHSKNGLIQETLLLDSGFQITLSIATGVCGESTLIIIYDTNCYSDEDRRSKRHKEYTIPINNSKYINSIISLFKKAMIKRKDTLIKK